MAFQTLKVTKLYSLFLAVLAEGQFFQRDVLSDFESAHQSEESPLMQSARLSDVYGSAKIASYSAQNGKWDPSGKGGVVCIHTALLPDSRILCFERPHQDPYPANPYTGNRLSTQIDLLSKVNSDGTWEAAFSPIDINNNPFCAGHSQLLDGSILVVGGDNHSVAATNGNSDFIVNGRQGIRTFTPCSPGSPASCLGTWKIFPDMSSQRWYPTVVTLADGSAIIIGGQTKNIQFDKLLPTDNNPSYEYFPSKSGQWPRRLEILDWSFPHNLYPPAFLLPSGNVFLLVSNKTIIINTETEEITNLPDLIAADHSPWIYPHSPTMFVLPITIANNFKFELMVCGGSKLSSKDASASCYKIAPEDSNPTWIKLEDMPNARLMPDSVILPDGTILVVNGASSGQAGGNQGQTQYASGPVFAADLYDPATSSWTTLASASNMRLYHSGALLLESGHVVTTGSEMDNYADYWPTPNPTCFENLTNIDTNPARGCTDPFNYNIERFTPPYLQISGGPTIVKAPSESTHGSLIQLDVSSTAGISRVTFVRMATTTHSTNTDQRLIELVILAYTDMSLFVLLPSNPALAVAGNWFIWALNSASIPSAAKMIHLKLGNAVNVTLPSNAKTGPPAMTEKNSAFSSFDMFKRSMTIVTILIAMITL